MAINFVARDGDKFTYPRLYYLCWHFIVDENIITPIVALTSTMILPRLLKI